MNWEKLDIHIENIIPGIVLLTVLLIGWEIPLGSLSGRDGLLVSSFIGVSYMLGAVSNVLARLLLDFILTKTLRPYFMRFFLGHRLENDDPSPSEISMRFSTVITAGLSCGNARVEAEVAKRRQTGRIIRSTLIPSILTIVATARHQSWGALQGILAGIGIYTAILIVYGYAEVVVFQEGYRGEQIKKENIRTKPETAAVTE